MTDSSFQHHPKLGRALLLLAGQVSIVVVLHRLGRYSWMRVDWSDLGEWLDDTPAEDVLLASARMLALVLAWWLLVSTLLYVGAAFAGWQRGLRSMRWAMVPGVGRLLDSMLAISLTSTPAVGALVATTPPAAVQEVDAAGAPVGQATPGPDEDAVAFKLAIYQARAPLPPVPEGPPGSSGPGSGTTYTVEPGDCLWEIAESQLGDPTRWEEIWDLNRPRREAAGYDDGDGLRIGWVLDLPREPGTVPPVTPTTAAAPADPTPATHEPGTVEAAPIEVTVEQGDHLWGIARERLEAEWGRPVSDAELAPYWADVVEANRARLAPPHDPDLIHPGQQLVTPPPPPDPLAPPAPPPSPTPPAPAPDVSVGEASSLPSAPTPAPTPDDGPGTTTPTPGDPRGTPTVPGDQMPLPESPGVPSTPPTPDDRSTPDDRPAAEEDDDPVRVSLGLLGGGIGVAGMLMTVDRLRQSHLQRRSHRRDVHRDAESLARAEAQLRSVADVEAASLLDAALRAAAAGAGAGGLPLLRWVEATRDEVVLTFVAPAPVTVGFAADADDRWRTAARLAELDALGGDVSSPAPCLAAVGSTGSGVEVLTDLAAHGLVSVVADDDATRAWLRALAVSLVASPWSASPWSASPWSASPWSASPRVVLVGFDDALARLPSVQARASLAEAVVDLDQAPAGGEPVVVLSAVAPSPADRRTLVGLTTGGDRRIVVVCPQGADGPLGSVCSIDPAGWLRLSGVDTPVRASQLGPEDTDLVVQLLLAVAGTTTPT